MSCIHPFGSQFPPVRQPIYIIQYNYIHHAHCESATNKHMCMHDARCAIVVRAYAPAPAPAPAPAHEMQIKNVMHAGTYSQLVHHIIDWLFARAPVCWRR